MNRDRAISVVLALLLLASLFGNWILWRKSQAPAGAPPVAAGPEARSSKETRERGVPGVHVLKANPELKGRLGRILITYAEDATLNPDSTRTAFFRAGEAKQVHTAYGPVTAELAPGTYDLEINGKKIAGIPVKSGHDTLIPSGVIRFHGADETRFPICDVGGEESFRIAYGNALVGLPAGEYEVEISGSREKVTVEAGKVTDF